MTRAPLDSASVSQRWPRCRWLLLLPIFLIPIFVMGVAPLVALEEGDPIDPMTFFHGKWSLLQYDAEGTVVGNATTHAYPVLDGTMTQIDYRGLDRSGEVVFRGTTLRTARPGGGFIVRWAMSNLVGFTYLTEELRAGVLHGEGHGVDGNGPFLERYRYFDLSDDSYSFQLERSLDEGATWSKGPLAVAKRLE